MPPSCNLLASGTAVTASEDRPAILLRWIIDPDGILKPCPQATMSLSKTGLLRWLARIHPEDRQELIDLLSASPVPSPLVLDVRRRTAERDERWLRLTLSNAVRPDGCHFDAIAIDISDMKETERALIEHQASLRSSLIDLQKTKGKLEAQSGMLMSTARELESARAAAEEASRVKSEFLSNMSHELRTPLNAIIGFSQIIKEQTFGPVGSTKYRDYATDIHDSGLHLLELINEVLDYSKIEAGAAELQEEIVDVSDIVDSVIRMIGDRATKQGVELIVVAEDNLPKLRADAKKIRQILLNLLTNAIKFTQKGGMVTVTIWARSGSGYVLQVADTGIGISLADIPKALGVFGQVDSSFSRQHEGTGLGLPLTKSLAELHGGSLDLQSQPGVGTTVTIRLPAERLVGSAGSIASAEVTPLTAIE